MDDRLQSSSELNNGNSKQQWRLNKQPKPGVPGGWVALESDKEPWLQISLFRQTSITGVIVQGREDKDQWVSSYKVRTSLDNTLWNYVPGIDINGKITQEEVKSLSLFDQNSIFVHKMFLYSL